MSNDPLAAQILRVVARSLDNAVKNGCAEAMSKMSVEDIAYDLAQYDVDCERVPIEQLKAGVQAWLKPQPSDATLQAQEAAQILREAEDWLGSPSPIGERRLRLSAERIIRNLVGLLKAPPSSGPLPGVQDVVDVYTAPPLPPSSPTWDEVERIIGETRCELRDCDCELNRRANRLQAAVDRARAAADQQHQQEKEKAYKDGYRHGCDETLTLCAAESERQIIESLRTALTAARAEIARLTEARDALQRALGEIAHLVGPRSSGLALSIHELVSAALASSREP